MRREEYHKIQEELLLWFLREKRDLPWRDTKDAYKIWVSEIMLQQTRVETVKDYFRRFMEHYPTVYDLASAKEEDVLKLWEGLGYYSRARNLYKGAKIVTEKYNGKVPNAKKDILSLPGIGDYTAGAVLSIAYNESIPAVDGNVLRVMSRVLGIWDNISDQKTKKDIQDVLLYMIPEGHAGDFNEGLMELGATICTPKSPSCKRCPLQKLCTAFEEGFQDELPIKSKKKKQKKLEYIVAYIAQNDKFLMKKRSDKGILAGMWELPMVEVSAESNMEEIVAKFLGEYGIHIQLRKELGIAKHIFTHQIWAMRVCIGEIIMNPKQKAPDEVRWMTKEELAKYMIPSAFEKVWEIIEENKGKDEKG